MAALASPPAEAAAADRRLHGEETERPKRAVSDCRVPEGRRPAGASAQRRRAGMPAPTADGRAATACRRTRPLRRPRERWPGGGGAARRLRGGERRRRRQPRGVRARPPAPASGRPASSLADGRCATGQRWHACRGRRRHGRRARRRCRRIALIRRRLRRRDQPAGQRRRAAGRAAPEPGRDGPGVGADRAGRRGAHRFGAHGRRHARAAIEAGCPSDRCSGAARRRPDAGRRRRDPQHGGQGADCAATAAARRAPQHAHRPSRARTAPTACALRRWHAGGAGPWRARLDVRQPGVFGTPGADPRRRISRPFSPHRRDAPVPESARIGRPKGRACSSEETDVRRCRPRCRRCRRTARWQPEEADHHHRRRAAGRGGGWWAPPSST